MLSCMLLRWYVQTTSQALKGHDFFGVFVVTVWFCRHLPLTRVVWVPWCCSGLPALKKWSDPQRLQKWSPMALWHRSFWFSLLRLERKGTSCRAVSQTWAKVLKTRELTELAEKLSNKNVPPDNVVFISPRWDEDSQVANADAWSAESLRLAWLAGRTPLSADPVNHAFYPCFGPVSLLQMIWYHRQCRKRCPHLWGNSDGRLFFFTFSSFPHLFASSVDFRQFRRRVRHPPWS